MKSKQKKENESEILKLSNEMCDIKYNTDIYFDADYLKELGLQQ